MSLSGNLLVHVHVQEEAELELDRDEMRKLARGEGGEPDDDDYARRGGGYYSSRDNDASTIATTRSARVSMQKRDEDGRPLPSTTNMVDSDPNSAILLLRGHDGDPHANVNDARTEKGRERMREIVFSPPFRRSLFLGMCFVLLGLGVLLTLENFMSVKSVRDWIEPSSMMARNNGRGGIDWNFGRDAPPPIAGAAVDGLIENNIADWARDTSRVSTAAGLDGYGSVALSDVVLFKDVPFFWGLPFAGGSIIEIALGQCMGLVQASDGKGMEEGKELRLSTVYFMGRKYLNVDLSTAEGVERARALALGTSGMADVVYSPLLHEMSGLFTPTNQGRMFVVVRHPVEREFARFRWLRRWDHGKLLESDKDMSYAEFAQSDYVADNWMTRALVGKDKGEELTAGDMFSAKEILRRKALVGLYSDIIGALRKYARYFGWDGAMNGRVLGKGTTSCFETVVMEGMGKDVRGATDLEEEDAREGSVAWRKIMEKNRFDFELYMYSKQLYKFQIALS